MANISIGVDVFSGADCHFASNVIPGDSPWCVGGGAGQLDKTFAPLSDHELSIPSVTADPVATFPLAILKPRKANPFYARHPWVLDSAIQRIEGEPADGATIDLISDKGKWIARGVFNRRSRIQVRLYTWKADEQLDEAFLRRRLERAIQLRTELGLDDPRGGARLVYSEADGLSGLIVDRYGEYLVLYVTALAMAQRADLLSGILEELLRPASILLRVDPTLASTEGIELSDGPLRGVAPEGPVLIDEHGLQYSVDLTTGQKTGYYLDQRDNRRVAAQYFRGRRVLDMFCYTGGFGLAAAKLGGAAEVLGVDSSRRAIALAESNAALNEITNVKFRVGEAFDVLDELVAAGEKFSGIVLDPPKFARGRKSLEQALRAYHRLNRQALELLEPGGILVTCSCSGHVTPEDFLYMLIGVAHKSGRDLQFLERRGASPDHPTSADCLENEYLKCFICRVS